MSADSPAQAPVKAVETLQRSEKAYRQLANNLTRRKRSHCPVNTRLYSSLLIFIARQAENKNRKMKEGKEKRTNASWNFIGSQSLGQHTADSVTTPSFAC
jgi:hypothetical protein